MLFSCNIDMDNDAFAKDPHAELSKVIKKISSEVDGFRYNDYCKNVSDYNGNKIGFWMIIGDNNND